MYYYLPIIINYTLVLLLQNEYGKSTFTTLNVPIWLDNPAASILEQCTVCFFGFRQFRYMSCINKKSHRGNLFSFKAVSYLCSFYFGITKCNRWNPKIHTVSLIFLSHSIFLSMLSLSLSPFKLIYSWTSFQDIRWSCLFFLFLSVLIKFVLLIMFSYFLLYPFCMCCTNFNIFHKFIK